MSKQLLTESALQNKPEWKSSFNRESAKLIALFKHYSIINKIHFSLIYGIFPIVYIRIPNNALIPSSVKMARQIEKQRGELIVLQSCSNFPNT